MGMDDSAIWEFILADTNIDKLLLNDKKKQRTENEKTGTRKGG